MFLERGLYVDSTVDQIWVTSLSPASSFIPSLLWLFPVMASHCRSGLSCSRVLKPVAPASVGAWVEHLQSDCLPCPGRTLGLWRAVALSVPLVSGCPPLYCGVLEGCWPALAQSPRPPRSSTPFCRPGRLSLRTDQAKSAWSEAANWARWSRDPCPSRCCCRLPQNRRAVWVSRK